MACSTNMASTTALPARLGGLGVPKSTSLANQQLEKCAQVTGPLLKLIIRKSRDYPGHKARAILSWLSLICERRTTWHIHLHTNLWEATSKLFLVVELLYFEKATASLCNYSTKSLLCNALCKKALLLLDLNVYG